MKEHLIFALKVLALSIFSSIGLVFLAAMAGLALYIVLDPRMPADDLAAFGIALFPFLGLGGPAIVVASRLALLRRHAKAQLAIYAATLLCGSIGFAGFWVGAMGI